MRWGILGTLLSENRVTSKSEVRLCIVYLFMIERLSVFMELGGRIEPFGNLHLAWS